ncbi:MAG TPA: hypothetical protein VJP79_12535 [Nitrososphaera sp.]|nr:hypothetical protein [Nitrososphaera sp.]
MTSSMAFSQNIRGYARLIDSSLSFQLTEPTHVYTHARGRMRLFSKLSISGTFWGETAETQLVRDMGLAHPDVIKSASSIWERPVTLSGWCPGSMKS